jgi:hypothetical protein
VAGVEKVGGVNRSMVCEPEVWRAYGRLMQRYGPWLKYFEAPLVTGRVQLSFHTIPPPWSPVQTFYEIHGFESCHNE